LARVILSQYVYRQQKNRAKYEDGNEHFKILNEKLQEAGIAWKYHFKFLSPEDITEFYAAIRENRYEKWKSKLMHTLS
jgi:type III restriction enzyme